MSVFVEQWISSTSHLAQILTLHPTLFSKLSWDAMVWMGRHANVLKIGWMVGFTGSGSRIGFYLEPVTSVVPQALSNLV